MCQREGLRAEANTLAQLATLAQNDVRACLNTLQFVRAKSAVLTDEMVTSGSIGRCKSAKNVFELWKQVFVGPAHPNPNPHSHPNPNPHPHPNPNPNPNPQASAATVTFILSGAANHTTAIQPLQWVSQMNHPNQA